MPGIKAFVAAVFGGIGSIPGAFIGGILLGVIEILSKAYISSQTVSYTHLDVYKRQRPYHSLQRSGRL